MKKYKIIKLEEPEGRITHKLEFESETKLTKDSGGYNCGVILEGTRRECLAKKRELEGK